MKQFVVFALAIAISMTMPLGAEPSESQKIEKQIAEQRHLRSQYGELRDKAQEQCAGYRNRLEQMKQARRAKEASALSTAQMKIDDIKAHIRRIENDMQGSVNKIMHSELKQVRDEETPDGKPRKEKPYSSPGADLSNVQTGSDADGGGEDNTDRVMTSGDHEAVLREMSPAIKFEFLKQLKSQYEQALMSAQGEYSKALDKLHATDQFSSLLQAEAGVQGDIDGCESEIALQKRNIQRQDLRLEGLHERLAAAMMKEGKMTGLAQPDGTVAGGTADIGGQGRSTDKCAPGFVWKNGKCVSPFDDNYDDFTRTMGDRDDNRGQDQSDRIAADQTSKGGNKSGYTSDDLTQDLTTTQDGLAGKCTKDTHCPPGYVCRNGGCVGKPDKCVKDSDCPPGHECRHGECVEKPACSKDTDCPQGQTCKKGQCVAPTQVQAATLSISPANKAVVLNESVDFKAAYTDTDGTTKDVTAAADWSPSSSFSKGTIGVYPVTASYSGLSATAQITVVQEKGMDDITVNEKIVTVTFWDHGRLEDGDMIDILINGEVAFPGITLTFAKQSRTITMNADIIVVGFKALNEGTAPPNTASVTFSAVTAGKATQDYKLKTNQSANMNINYQP